MNQSLAKALSTKMLIVSYKGTFVKRDATSKETKMSSSPMGELLISLEKRMASVMVYSLIESGFSFSSNHLARF